MLDGITTWLDEHGFASIEQMQGSVRQRRLDDPVAFTRSNYMQMLVNYTGPYDWRDIPGSVQA